MRDDNDRLRSRELPHDPFEGTIRVERERDSISGPIRSAAIGEGVTAERILPFKTALELRDELTGPTQWVAKPWAARGVITELTGKAKVAGKTTFLGALVAAVLDGSLFLGESTEKTAVVYLTEEGRPTFKEMLRRSGLLDRKDLHLLFRRDAAGVPWAEVVRQAVERCKTKGAGVLIVDTLPPFAGFKGDAENQSGDALEAILPLQEAAAQGLAVIVVRHERKGGGDVGEAGRGSTAFGGAVDILLSIRRPDGNVRLNLREIHAASRFDETPPKLVIERTSAGYVVRSSAAIAGEEAEKAILRVVPKEAAAALTEKELLAAAELRRTTGQHAVEKLVREGLLRREGSGKKGDPWRYWHSVPETKIHSAAAQAPNGTERNEQARRASGGTS